MVVHQALVQKTESFLSSITHCRAVVLCGPSFSGKSTILKAATFYEKKANGFDLQSIRIHPKTCTPLQLYGWFSQDGYHTWNDGILTKHLRQCVNHAKSSTEEEKRQWIILDGLLDYKWAENMESFMTSGILVLHSGEELTISSQTSQIIFETPHLHDVSPSFISKTGIVITELNELKWTAFLDNWSRRTTEDQQVMRWRRGQEELITGLFHWLVPPLINLVRYKCNSVISPMPNSLARYMLEFFASTLSEAIGNLKERKYLRSWIQAACASNSNHLKSDYFQTLG